jgi:hypothetical protein
MPGLSKGKAMYLLFVKAEASTTSGIPVRSVLTSYYKGPHFLHRRHDLYNSYTSPDEIILCPDSRQSMYCQLLCGVVDANMSFVLGRFLPQLSFGLSAFLRRIGGRSLDYVYRRCRTHDKPVGPLEIRVVQAGAFDGSAGEPWQLY